RYAHSSHRVPTFSARYPAPSPSLSLLFFFNATATTEIYTLSLHDALPISRRTAPGSPSKNQRGERVMTFRRTALVPQKNHATLGERAFERTFLRPPTPAPVSRSPLE